MRGARDYAKLFSTGQHGKLYLVSGEHARGKTFQIWILPSDEKVSVMPWRVNDAVEVYGATGGQLGWTETYGWLHTGKWQEDFNKLVKIRIQELERSQKERERVKAEDAAAVIDRKSKLLSAY
jgi:hypothetical protein